MSDLDDLNRECERLAGYPTPPESCSDTLQRGVERLADAIRNHSPDEPWRPGDLVSDAIAADPGIYGLWAFAYSFKHDPGPNGDDAREVLRKWEQGR